MFENEVLVFWLIHIVIGLRFRPWRILALPGG